MKTIINYILEKKQDTNLENTQMEIDDMKSNETNQMKKMNCDSIKSIIINSPQMGKVINIVSDEGSYYKVRIAKEHYIVNNMISGVVINIAKYFKETMGSPKIELNKKNYEIKIYKK